jgi:uncharacterized membrane protein YecN with MAPEG domain
MYKFAANHSTCILGIILLWIPSVRIPTDVVFSREGATVQFRNITLYYILQERVPFSYLAMLKVPLNGTHNWSIYTAGMRTVFVSYNVKSIIERYAFLEYIKTVFISKKLNKLCFLLFFLFQFIKHTSVVLGGWNPPKCLKRATNWWGERKMGTGFFWGVEHI